MTAINGPGPINHPPDVDQRLPSNEAVQQAAAADEPRESNRESRSPRTRLAAERQRRWTDQETHRMAEPRVLPEIRVQLSRVPPGEKAVPLGYPESLGLQTKLGGEPDWIQDPFDRPACLECAQDMTFVAQIDSVEHDSKHNPLRRDAVGPKDYMFGDVGMIYVFFCFECSTTQSVFQQY